MKKKQLLPLHEAIRVPFLLLFFTLRLRRLFTNTCFSRRRRFWKIYKRRPRRFQPADLQGHQFKRCRSGSFRDAVSAPGRIVAFTVGGIINLTSDVVVAANTTIAGQTAPGYGIVLFGKRVTFTNANNTICRYLRIRLGATNNSRQRRFGHCQRRQYDLRTPYVFYLGNGWSIFYKLGQQEHLAR